MERKIRVLVAKPGLDGDDRGALVLCEAFKEAGMEVIYTGVHQTPEMIVEAAIAEDVEVVALRRRTLMEEKREQRGEGREDYLGDCSILRSWKWKLSDEKI